VENLEIEFHNVRLSDWTFFISTLIDLTRVVQIKLPSKLIYEAEPVMLAEITGLLKQTCNLSSLDLFMSYRYVTSKLSAEDICLITPSHVRHLSAPIKSFNEIKNVLERLEHLSSVKFDFQDNSPQYGFIKWLKERRKGSSYIIDSRFMCVWLGKKLIEPKQINVGAKRIKLSKDS
jgi:hypothetical protein